MSKNQVYFYYNKKDYKNQVHSLQFWLMNDQAYYAKLWNLNKDLYRKEDALKHYYKQEVMKLLETIEDLVETVEDPKSLE